MNRHIWCSTRELLHDDVRILVELRYEGEHLRVSTELLGTLSQKKISHQAGVRGPGASKSL